MKTILLAFCLIVISAFSYAQTISGYVKDAATKEAIPFASIKAKLESDSSTIASSSSDEKGYYILRLQNTNRKVFIEAKAFGYKTVFKTYAVGQTEIQFLLESETKSTATTSIVAQKNPITYYAGKTEIDIQGSSNYVGLSVLDILSQTPGVQVDNQGNVSLMGKSNVLIMIDNRIMNLSATELVSLLKSMPSSQLKKIELMTNPGAKYDAQGSAGIVHLVTRKGLKDSFNIGGSISQKQGFYPKHNSSIYASLGIKKVTLRSQYSLEEAINKTRLYQDKLFIQPSGGATAQGFNQEVKIITTNHILNNDLSVKLRNGQSITCGYLVYKDNTVNNGDTKSYITSIDNKYSPSRAADYNTEGSFTHQMSTRYEFKPDSSRHQIDIGLDYVISKQILRQNLNVVYDNFLVINEQRIIGSVMYNPVQSHFFIPRVDYSYSFSDSLKFEMGLKANILDLNNEIARTNSYIKNGINSDSLNPSNYAYKEQILAAYFTTDYKWGKMDINLGLRAENWHATGIQKVNGASLERNQFQLFPSLSLSYQATPSIQFITNYSRRIDRPDYDQLNPSARFIDAYTRSKGNPMLLPSLSNNLEIGTNFLDGLAGFTISAFQANNPILGFAAVADKDTNYKTVLQPQNLQSLNNLNISTYYSPDITKIWHIDISGNVFYNKISGQYSGASSTNSAWGYNGNVRQKVTLGKSWELNVNFMYINRGIWGVLKFKDYYDLSFGIQKTFWAEKCTISLWGRNILNSNYYRAATNTPNLKDSGAYLRDNQLIQLSLTWKLGNLKKEHKEVEKIFNKGNGGGF